MFLNKILEIYQFVNDSALQLNLEDSNVEFALFHFMHNTVIAEVETIANTFNLQWDSNIGLILEGDDILKYAVCVLFLLEVLRIKGAFFPLTFNNNATDGLIVEYIEQDTFKIINYLDSAPCREMDELFLKKVCVYNDDVFSSSAGILLLCYFYQESGDMSLAVSDWLFEVSLNEELLIDFEIDQNLLTKFPPNNLPPVFLPMITSCRLDAVSYKILYHACREGVW